MPIFTQIKKGMQNPLVSIIIPTYNRANLIRETLDSVMAQTYTNWECIVVDDGSNDTTSELLSDYCKKNNRFQYHHRPKARQKGANACRNYGFELSKGEYIQFLDSDDLLESFCLSERVYLILKDPTIDIVVRDSAQLIGNIKNKLSINKDPELKCNKEYLKMFLRYEIPWSIMGAFYKRSILHICKFDEDIERFQDVSFNIKVLNEIYSLKLLRDFKIDTYHRIDKNKLQLKGYVQIVLETLMKFNKNQIILISNIEYKRSLQLYNYYFIQKILIPFFNKNKRISNMFIISTFNSKLFIAQQKMAMIFLFLYLNLGLLSKKGVGVDRFRKYLSKSFLSK